MCYGAKRLGNNTKVLALSSHLIEKGIENKIIMNDLGIHNIWRNKSKYLNLKCVQFMSCQIGF